MDRAAAAITAEVRAAVADPRARHDYLGLSAADLERRLFTPPRNVPRAEAWDGAR